MLSWVPLLLLLGACSMPEHPESFPVNALVPIKGTPLEGNEVGIPSIQHRRPSLSCFLACFSSCASPYDRYCQNRPSDDDHPAGRGKAGTERERASNVFHGWSECCVYG